jgi:transcription-repair coupling factor (superfamily II helicase)
MIDRFGLLPEAVKNVFRVTALKLVAEPMGVAKIEVGKQDGRILFGQEPAIDTGKLVELLQNQPGTYRFDGGNSLRFGGDYEQEEKRFRTVTEILTMLSIPERTPDNRTTTHA